MLIAQGKKKKKKPERFLLNSLFLTIQTMRRKELLIEGGLEIILRASYYITEVKLPKIHPIFCAF
jgi:hypothetical protein